MRSKKGTNELLLWYFRYIFLEHLKIVRNSIYALLFEKKLWSYIRGYYSGWSLFNFANKFQIRRHKIKNVWILRTNNTLQTRRQNKIKWRKHINLILDRLVWIKNISLDWTAMHILQINLNCLDNFRTFCFNPNHLL